MNGMQDDSTTENEKRESSAVKITGSESGDPGADANPGRTPGKAEGVEDPEKEGNE